MDLGLEEFAAVQLLSADLNQGQKLLQDQLLKLEDLCWCLGGLGGPAMMVDVVLNVPGDLDVLHLNGKHLSDLYQNQGEVLMHLEKHCLVGSDLYALTSN